MNTSSPVPITRIQQFQKQFSTITVKMSKSNNNFLPSEVFNVKGKVRAAYPSANTQLTVLGCSYYWRRKWYWSNGNPSPHRERSKSLHRRPHRREARERSQNPRPEHRRRNHPNRRRHHLEERDRQAGQGDRVPRKVPLHPHQQRGYCGQHTINRSKDCGGDEEESF
jgi:hypothetical protein